MARYRGKRSRSRATFGSSKCPRARRLTRLAPESEPGGNRCFLNRQSHDDIFGSVGIKACFFTFFFFFLPALENWSHDVFTFVAWAGVIFQRRIRHRDRSLFTMCASLLQISYLNIYPISITLTIHAHDHSIHSIP